MKDRPIIFSAPMIRAILDGKKTQTRRCVDPHLSDAQLCKYGQPGDRLWCRETHYRMPSDNPSMGAGFGECYYNVDCDLPTLDTLHSWGMFKKYPSIHMPRWASRITLEIVSVRAERLQEITPEDALAEGIIRMDDTGEVGHWEPFAVADFNRLWESINGDKPGKDWKSDPLVWRIEFKVVK